MGAIGLVIGTLFLAAATRALARRLGDRSLLVHLLIFTTLQSFLVLAAGLAGLLSALPLTLFSAAGIAALWVAGERLPRPDWHLPAEPADRLLAAGLLAGLLALLVKSLILSPYWPDALFYHLVTVAEWTRAGAIVPIATSDPRVWLPNGFQLVELWWVAFLHHDALIELGGIQMLLIALAALFTLAETLGLRPWLAAFLFAFIPLVILHATSCGNDLAVAAMVLAAFALTASRAPRALVLLPLLVGAGIKPTVLMVLPGVAAYAFLAEKPDRSVPLKALAPLLGIALVLAVFWYGRNIALQGHPLRPMIGGTAEAPFITAYAEISPLNITDTLSAFPRSALDRGPYTSLSGDSTSWGWFVLAVGFPASLLAVRDDPRLRRLLLAFIVGWFGVLLCIPHFAYTLRYALWFPAILLLGASRLPGKTVVAAAFLAAALNFLATVVPRETRDLGPQHHLPPDFPRAEPLVVLWSDHGYCYPLYNPDYSRRLVFPRTLRDVETSGARYAWVNDLPGWAEPLKPRLVQIKGRLHEIR